ncbi:hypothetical protein [Catellatospora citrea]|nr:hypothetical protein [Catellatospora citrea]
MSGLEFAAAMTSALIWPVIVLVLVLVFRGTIKSWLAERPTHLQAGPFSAQWERQAAKVGEGIEEGASPPAVADTQPGPEIRPTEVIELAHASPIGAIIEKSAQIERALVDKLSTHGLISKPASMRMLAERAAKEGLITMGLFSSIVGLSDMRNLAAHGRGDITPSQAVEFVVLAEAVLTELRGTTWFQRGA